MKTKAQEMIEDLDQLEGVSADDQLDQLLAFLGKHPSGDHKEKAKEWSDSKDFDPKDLKAIADLLDKKGKGGNAKNFRRFPTGDQLRKVWGL